MAANAVEGASRAMRGAVKRWYNHANATLTSGGSTNAHTLTYTVAPAAYASGDGYVFKAGFTNSGAATLNVNGLGAKAVQSLGAALAGNEIVSGRVAIVYYDGTNFQLVNSQIAGIQTGSTAAGDLSGTYPNPTVTTTHLSAPLPIAQGGTGVTSPSTAILSDYTAPTAWTPTDGSGAGLSFTVTDARYVKIGKVITVSAYITYPATGSGAAAKISGLPVAAASGTNPVGGGAVAIVSGVFTSMMFLSITPGGTTITVIQGSAAGTFLNSDLSGRSFGFTIMYITA